MTVAVRSLALAVLGLLLISGCGDDEGSNTAEDAPTSSSTGSSTGQVPESTSATDPDVADPVSAIKYDADFTVDDAGDLSVVETLTLDVPVDDRHGIYRSFVADVAVENFAATLDGKPTPISDTTENGERVFRIGDPDRTLDVGEHAVRMEYSVPDVLVNDGTLLDWFLVPGGWTMDIRAAELTVTLPEEATEADCTIGEAKPCDVRGLGTSTLVVTTGELEDHTGVRLLALMAS